MFAVDACLFEVHLLPPVSFLHGGAFACSRCGVFECAEQIGVGVSVVVGVGDFVREGVDELVGWFVAGCCHVVCELVGDVVCVHGVVVFLGDGVGGDRAVMVHASDACVAVGCADVVGVCKVGGEGFDIAVEGVCMAGGGVGCGVHFVSPLFVAVIYILMRVSNHVNS